MSLTLEEFKRYGRQMIVKEFGGLKSQLKLKASSVLIVGAGGLGSPAIAYLAGSGVGTIGIVDNDVVDISNLHRQIIHNEAGLLKVESAARFVQQLNPNVKVIPYPLRLTPTLECFEIFQRYDIILDCTDTPATRYLINDFAVLSGIPLVSASALKTEGQLSVLNFMNGPCYRCLFPIPPPPDSVTSCGDGGIIGPVVGIMGVQQSIEALKILIGHYNTENPFQPSLTLFSAFTAPQWRFIKMRGRKAGCVACGDHKSVTLDAIISGSLDYAEFCGRPSSIQPLSASASIQPLEYSLLLKKEPNLPHTLLDVREPIQYDICHLDNSLNIPYESLKEISDLATELKEPVYVVCRYGNDSKLAVHYLKSIGLEQVYDIIGGLNRWSKDVDPTFPTY